MHKSSYSLTRKNFTIIKYQNAKESEGEIMNYLSCNVVHYKRVRVLQWTQFKKNLKERATIKER